MRAHPLSARTRTALLAAGLAAAAATVLTGCSGSSTNSSSTAASPSSAAASGSATASAEGSASPSSAPATPAGSATPNGIQDKSVSDIITLTKAAGINATSVRVKGEVTQGNATSAIDMTLGKDSGAGTITEANSSVRLVVTPETVYVQAPKAFLTQQFGEKAAAAEGKWIAIPASDTIGQQYKTFAGAKEFMDGFLASVPNDLLKGQVEDIDGRQGLPLSSPPTTATASGSASAAAGAGATIWVSTTGQPYLLRIAPKVGEGHIDFLDWDAPTNITAPPQSDVVPLSSLK